MFAVLRVFIFIHINFILIQCLLPNNQPELTVQKLDEKLIERKRQDTVDMCRMFTEETRKLNIINRKSRRNKHIRTKRAIGQQAVNPALNLEDAKRVESIVDKMYDDLNERGENIEYRRADLTLYMNNVSDATTTATKEPTSKSGRKFNFAPALIVGPKATHAPFMEPEIDSPVASKRPRFLHGVVPYFIDSKTYDAHLAEVIIKAFDYFEKVTCIRLQRLRERPTDRESLQKVEWLYITNPTGIKQCVHSNDRTEIKGVQMIVFGYNCMSLGDITHEIMHVLGFSHEHIRPDRDHYITILWDNIKPGYKKYFELLNKPVVENLPYDYASVLHYPPRAFSRNGQVTIMTQPGVKVGQREGLSEIDVEKISAVYSTECVKRNREYLLKTCPSVVKSRPETKPVNVTKKEIERYYEDRLWTYAIVNYRLRDKMEFSNEERENINAVIRHIEKETCIEFRDLTSDPHATIEVEEPSSETKGSGSGSVSSNRLETASGAETVSGTGTGTAGSGSEKSSGKVSEISDNRITERSEKSASDEDTPAIKEDNDIAYSSDENASSKAALSSEKSKASSSESGRKSPDATVASQKSTDASLQSADYISEGALRIPKRFSGNKKSIRLVDSYLPRKTITKNNTDIHAKSTNSDATKKKTPISPSRRHATNILIFTRSAKPGCECPKSGVPGTVTTVEINADCFNSVNDLLHLFVHILGLDHQHNSHDRDSYLHIMWDQLTDKIKNDMVNKLPPAASVGFPYDYQSVMHYPWLQIKNGRTNIMYPIWNDGWAMGHWQGLSSIDVQKLNLLYYKQCVLRRQQADEAELLRMGTTLK